MLKNKLILAFLAVYALFPAFSPADDDDLFSDDSFFTDDTLAGQPAVNTGQPASAAEIPRTNSSSAAGAADTPAGSPAAAAAESAGSRTPAGDSAAGAQSSPVSAALFKIGSVRFGGRLDGRLDTEITFEDIEKSTLVPVLSGSVFFDARPQENLRLYGKMSFDYPFTASISAGTEISLIKIPELFTDFSAGDTVFFRFGKHQAVWGTGYFFSPADVINIAAIDPEDPSKEREGPLSLRTLITSANSTSSLWLYVIPDTESFEARKTAVAAKYEFLAGDIELGTGFWYAYPRPPRLALTVTGALSRNLNIFAEGTAAWGSEEQWAAWANPPDSGSSSETDTDSAVSPSDMGLFFQAAAGFSLTVLDKLTVTTQYFFNGFGTDDVSSLTYQEYSEKILRYTYPGRHYAAALLSISNFPARRMSVSAFSLISLADFSGTAQLTISCPFITSAKPRLVLSAGPAFTFGADNSEYMTSWKLDTDTPIQTQKNPSVSFKIAASFGGGKF